MTGTFINDINLLPLDHLSCHLQQLMRRTESPFAYFAEHLRKFEQARFAIELLDARECATLVDQFLHLIVLVTEHCQLWKMSHAKNLM